MMIFSLVIIIIITIIIFCYSSQGAKAEKLQAKEYFRPEEIT